MPIGEKKLWFFCETKNGASQTAENSDAENYFWQKIKEEFFYRFVSINQPAFWLKIKKMILDSHINISVIDQS